MLLDKRQVSHFKNKLWTLNLFSSGVSVLAFPSLPSTRPTAAHFRVPSAVGPNRRAAATRQYAPETPTSETHL